MMKKQNFGVEIELTGITREQAANVIAAYFGTQTRYFISGKLPAALYPAVIFFLFFKLAKSAIYIPLLSVAHRTHIEEWSEDRGQSLHSQHLTAGHHIFSI